VSENRQVGGRGRGKALTGLPGRPHEVLETVQGAQGAQGVRLSEVSALNW